VNLTSYAELAVRLVNTSASVNADPDWLGSPKAFRTFVADRPHLAGQVTYHDLDALRLLRTELALIFSAAAEGNDAEAADRLNALLISHPVHPVLVRHDGPRWHLHLTEAGSVADRYAADATIGLATVVTEYGMNRLGICAIAACQCAFIDSSTNRCRRYCSDHCSTRATVTAFRARGAVAAGGPPSTATG
jgi:predicted RNA-binding Zn ribbon-like protein